MDLPLRTAAPIIVALLGASCGSQSAEEEAMRTVSGEVIVPNAEILSQDADLVVAFRALNGEVLAESRSRVNEQEPPFDFRIWIPTNRIGTVGSRIESGEITTWRSVLMLLDDGTEPVDIGTLMMEPIEPAPEALGGTAPQAQLPVRQAAVAQQPAVQSAQAPRQEVTQSEPETAFEPATIAEAAAAPGPEAGPTRLTCGDSEITVNLESGQADVAVGETVVEMDATGTANGTRRFALEGDPETYLSLGESAAEVSFAGVVLPECTVASGAD